MWILCPVECEMRDVQAQRLQTEMIDCSLRMSLAALSVITESNEVPVAQGSRYGRFSISLSSS